MEYSSDMDAKVQARIDAALKEEGEAILRELGMTTTELVRMTFRQLVMRRGLPFDVRLPNEKTTAALAEETAGAPRWSVEELRARYAAMERDARRE